MKVKKWILPVCILAGILVLCAAVLLLVDGTMGGKGIDLPADGRMDISQTEKPADQTDDPLLPEEEQTECAFTATVLELYDAGAVVQPVEGSPLLGSSDRIFFSTQNLEQIGAEVGSVVRITYTGEVMESYPAQIRAISWRLISDP